METLSAAKRILAVLLLMLAAAFAVPAAAMADEKDWTDNEHVQGVQECVVTAGGVTGGLAAQGAKAVGKASASALEVGSLVPGWGCGSYIGGELFADVTCSQSQQGNWAAKTYVLAATWADGEPTTEC